MALVERGAYSKGSPGPGLPYPTPGTVSLVEPSPELSFASCGAPLSAVPLRHAQTPMNGPFMMAQQQQQMAAAMYAQQQYLVAAAAAGGAGAPGAAPGVPGGSPAPGGFAGLAGLSAPSPGSPVQASAGTAAPGGFPGIPGAVRFIWPPLSLKYSTVQ